MAASEPTDYGKWINKKRLLRQLSVGDLQSESGISHATIYNIEAGRVQNPNAYTRKALEDALGAKAPKRLAEKDREDAAIPGLGSLESFDPYERAQVPAKGGVYVLYDITERPVYVGKSNNMKTRITQHKSQKDWFFSPIVETGSYILIADDGLRDQIERTLIQFLKSNAVLNKQLVKRG